MDFSKKCRDTDVDDSRWSMQLIVALKYFPFYFSWNTPSVPKKSKGDLSHILLGPSGYHKVFLVQAGFFLFLIFCHLLIQSFLIFVILSVLFSFY